MDAPQTGEGAHIGKSVVIKGELSGSENLYVKHASAQSTAPSIAFAYGSRRSLFGLQRSPLAGSNGPVTRYPYSWPGVMPGTRPCHTPAS